MVFKRYIGELAFSWNPYLCLLNWQLWQILESHMKWFYPLVMTYGGLRKNRFVSWNFWNLSNITAFTSLKKKVLRNQVLNIVAQFLWFYFPVDKIRSETKGFLECFHEKIGYCRKAMKWLKLSHFYLNIAI